MAVKNRQWAAWAAWVLGGVLAFANSQVLGQSMSLTHCFGECPRYESQLAAERAKVVVHHLYAAGLNGDSGLADWSAYRLTAEAIGVASLLPRAWRPDRLVQFSPLQDLLLTDDAELSLAEISTNNSNPYAGSGVTESVPDARARLAPMTSFANTPYWSDLNNLSNMVPMPADLRRGVWLQLEQRLNRAASRHGELYVIAGPLFLISNLSPFSAEQNQTPAAYYKVVAHSSGVAAFVFPAQLGQNAAVCDYQATLADVEGMAGLSLLPDRSVTRSDWLLAELGCS
ncbi:MAG: DNA/RNA non-specific endonuclease [Pseudohongiellaceae bacterium]|jgi:DNA/RNA endonuclease G (NUC1)